MSNKKLHLAFGFVLAVFVGLIGSFTSAVTFKLEFGGGYAKPESRGAIRQNMIPIHFADNGNDFHGFLYFSDGIVESTESTNDLYFVKLNTDVVECQKKVKGFYYNAERGEILWPLDGKYGDIEAIDGLYTRCRQAGYSDALANRCGGMGEKEREECEREVGNEFKDSNGYYGMVTHVANGQTGKLIIGTNYEIKSGEQWITIGDELEDTMVRIDNKYPVGFIYDVNGGVGFAGCKIINDGDVKDVLRKFNAAEKNWRNLFSKDGNSVTARTDLNLDCSDEGSAMNSLIKVIVDGLVGMSNDAKNTGIQRNQSNAKMQYFSSVSVNNMQLINYARQRAEILCRGKWNNYSESDKIICISSNEDIPYVAPLNKTLIIKGGRSVKIQDMNDSDDGYYDIFVDGGDLFINPKIIGSTDDLTVFKANGFKSDKNVEGFRVAVNSVHNYSGSDVAAGRFIRGNFIVNGNIKSAENPSLENVYFIYGKMTSKDSIDDLEKVFTWKCNVGTGSDGTPCPGGWKAVDGTTWNNPYQNASLVIIDQNYPSPLYK